MDEEGLQARQSDIQAALDEMKRWVAEPEKKLLCSSVRIVPAGTRLIKPFGFYEEKETLYGCSVAPISVWRMELTPNDPANAQDLGKHVCYATRKLAKMKAEFLSPETYSLSENAYKRPSPTRLGSVCFV